MPECDYCGEEFDSEEDLHLHWGEEHGEELNSHEKEKVKKAERKRDEQKKDKMRKRKQYAGYALGGALALVLVGIVGAQLMNSGGTAAFDSLEDQPMMGEEDAPVTVVEFGDYKCPHCATFEFDVLPQLKENFIDSGQVKYYFINFPILGGDSTNAAVASECVYKQDQDQFWDYHKALFENQQGETDAESLVQLAEDSTEGLDYGQLENCIRNQGTISDVNSDRQKGQTEGVSSTPTVYVNGDQVANWEYNNLAQKIENALNE